MRGYGTHSDYDSVLVFGIKLGIALALTLASLVHVGFAVPTKEHRAEAT